IPTRSAISPRDALWKPRAPNTSWAATRISWRRCSAGTRGARRRGGPEVVMRRSLLATYLRSVGVEQGIPGAPAVRMPGPLASLRVELDIEVDGRRPGGRVRSADVAQRIPYRPRDGQRLERRVVRGRRPAGELLADHPAPR